MFPIKFQLSNPISAIFSSVAYLENIVGTFSAEVVLAWQDNHRLCKHLQADGTNQLFLQVIHGIHFRRALLAGRKTTTKPPQIKPHKLRNVRTKIRFFELSRVGPSQARDYRPAALVPAGVGSYLAAVSSVFSSYCCHVKGCHFYRAHI